MYVYIYIKSFRAKPFHRAARSMLSKLNNTKQMKRRSLKDSYDSPLPFPATPGEKTSLRDR